jgi:hypothetical protein
VIRKCFLIPFTVLLFLIVHSPQMAGAQTSDQEVFLQFRHQAVVNTYISAIYEQDQFYLSVNELFDPLLIDLNIDSGNLVLSGNYLGKGRYTINLNTRVATFLDRELTLTADDYIITEMGFYLLPDIFYKLFELEFIIDFSRLSVSLISSDTMPVVAQRERERQRERILRTQQELLREYYPLRFDRNKQVFNAGFLDYNLTANYNRNGGNFLYSTSLGSELFGGDLQGTIFGSYSQTASSFRSSGLRWRYGILDNEWVSTITAGQSGSQGLTPAAYTGIRVTNEPIEPRFLYGETAFTGSVEPNSEVELYRNNSLVDYTIADETGQYRFTVPITYGTSNYNIRVFSPTGIMTQQDARLQVPFNFLPPGEITYSLDAGRLDNPISGSTERGLMTNLSVSGGITNRLTTTGGVEYFEDFHDGLPTFKAGISSRFFTNYLLSVEAANDAFYRASASVIYPTNASINLDYTNYNVRGGIYNPSRNKSSIRANIFTPFEIGTLPLYFRWSMTNEQRETTSVTRYRVDLNTRLGRANLRLGYRDSQLGALSFQSTPVARVNASTTYNFSRSREIPQALRGVFLRGQMNFIPAQNRLEDAELQISRNINRNGRLQIAGGRNFIGEFNLFRFTFTFDFSALRTNSTVRTTRNSTTFTQSARGSLGYDSHHNKLLYTNRQQVGRSGVAVRLFVDNNNSGTFEDGDNLIADNAIRIDRAGGTRFSKDGISYISQLQPYRQYNLTINKGAINNPLLVPNLEQFSIITDPNQYKLLDIPFYMSGIIDGMVFRRGPDGTQTGLGGLRLYLRQINPPEGTERFSDEIRTFSDGSFYAYEIPPGDYTLEADPSQLNFLNVQSDPEKLEFTVRSLADGDFVEGLEINLIPDGYIAPDEIRPVITASLSDYQRFSFVNGYDSDCRYTVQAGSFSTFGEAFDFAEEAESILSGGLDIIFNSRNNLYSVRSSDSYSADELQNELFRLNMWVDQVAAVINRCISDSDELMENRLHIQLGTYPDISEADRIRDRFAAELDADVFIHVDRQDGLFRIFAGPYTSLRSLMDELQRLIFIRDGTEVSTSEADVILLEDTEYEYGLTLQEFPDTESALAFIEEIESLTEIELDIIQADSITFQVITKDRSDSWDELIGISNRLSEISELIEPVGQFFPVTEPKPDPVANTNVTEILEEEEFSENRQPLNSEITRLDYIHSEGNESSLSRCLFPIQAGSYGGHILAQSLADSIAQNLKTNIGLYYNELTDMYALRTESYQSLHQALSQLKTFKQVDPANEYAIVGKCMDRSAYRDNRPVQFLIPLIRYQREEQAIHFIEDLSIRTGLHSVIRFNHDSGLYSVYAGPFDRFTDAVGSRNYIIESNILSEPQIVIDSETRNRFNARFQIYFGSYQDGKDIENLRKEIELITGSQIIVRLEDKQNVHFFDGSVYSSWSNFVDIVQRKAQQIGTGTVEKMILD